MLSLISLIGQCSKMITAISVVFALSLSPILISSAYSADSSNGMSYKDAQKFGYPSPTDGVGALINAATAKNPSTLEKAGMAVTTGAVLLEAAGATATGAAAIASMPVVVGTGLFLGAGAALCWGVNKIFGD